jgi:hypothetical protein
MLSAKQLDELRSWLFKQMQDESQASGRPGDSDLARMRAMSKAVAYNRVLQKMDELAGDLSEPTSETTEPRR